METSSIKLNPKFAQQTLWEVIGMDDLVSEEIRQSFLEYDESAPFDRISSDYEIDNVLWEKKFPQTLDNRVPFLLQLAYFRKLMPELESLHPGKDRTLAIWKTRSVHEVMGEAFDAMSPTIKALLDESTTFNKLSEEFFTPVMAAKAEALQSSGRLHTLEIIRILMSGESVALAEGTL